MPAVTVIIPFHNRMEWLLESVRSVLVQTFTDFELILVNDGSDTFHDILQLSNDSRIRYVCQKNKGPAAARNFGISLAKGKYVAFLDSDDLLLPEKLEIQYRIMEENPSFGLSYTSYIRINENDELLETIKTGNRSVRLYPDILCGCSIATPTVMVRTDVLSSLRFDETLNYGEDVWLWIQLSKITDIIAIDIPLSKVRIHGTNAIFNSERQLSVGRYILRRSYKEDPALPLMLLLRAYSSLYVHQAYLLYKKKSYFKSVQYVLLSLLAHPVQSIDYIKRVYKG